MSIIIIGCIESVIKEKYEQHQRLFDESQRLRMESLLALYECGLALIELRDKLKVATKENPLVTDKGAFTSFVEYFDQADYPFSRRYAYEYIKLAENWHVVIKLGMQDSKHLKRSMRLCRTLKIIDWYNQQIAAGTDESELSLDLYWQLEDAAKLDRSGPTKKQLLDRIAQLESYVEQLLNELTIERSKQ